MLTSSPIPMPRSTSASPTARAFHYAPSRSPHSSPKIAVPLPRRQSRQSVPQSPSGSLGGGPARSPTQPPQQSKSRQYVGVDKGTSYSPMEPFDPTVPLRATTALEMPSAVEPLAKPLAVAAAPITGLAADPAMCRSVMEHENLSVGIHSPSKRRTSTDLVRPSATTDALASSSSGAPPTASATSVVQSQTGSPKRLRQAQSPPKPLPLRYELCDVEDMVVLIANMLGELIETNDSLAMKSGHLTRFHSRTAPGISVVDYLHRLAKHATLTPPLLLCMVYYIDRLCALYPDFTINTLTVHRFLITAATVAGKGLSDSFWNNSFYARVGGVKVAELKLLELEFLYRVDWKIVPNPEVLMAYYKGLVERCEGFVLEGEEETATRSSAEDDNEEDSDVIDDGDDSDISEG